MKAFNMLQYFYCKLIQQTANFIILMLKPSSCQPRTPSSYECETRRQHFNHLRNTSTNMRNCLSWDQPEESANVNRSIPQVNQPQQKYREAEEERSGKQKKSVTFVAKPNIESNPNKSAINNSGISNKRTNISQNASFNARDRSRSAEPQRKRGKEDSQDVEIRERIRERQKQEEALKQQERLEKVQQYIEDLKPYTRSLTNTKYQDYFNKAALESYGRANTKNAIGGIIYGNHQKTFNMNPHIRGNEPKTYQTHYTAINYGKRTKLNDEDKWNRLQKELCKKLGLKDKNETLKEGKEVVIVDVDESNMHSVMRQNLKFKRQHDEEIRQLEKDYKNEIEEEKKAAVEQFYAKKRERIMTNNTIDAQLSTYTCDRDQRERLQEQVIYRTTDKHGNVRMGADRHALTCFVDMNFPENSAAYTQELIDRSPIFPIEVEEKDKHIDDQRRQNYQKSLQNIYPSHYLLPNCDQPEIIKMLNKSGEREQGLAKSKGLRSTLGTTGINKSSLQAIEH